MASTQDKELNLFSTLNSIDNELSDCEKELSGLEKQQAYILNPLFWGIPLAVWDDNAPNSDGESQAAMEYFNWQLSNAIDRVLNNEQT